MRRSGEAKLNPQITKPDPFIHYISPEKVHCMNKKENKLINKSNGFSLLLIFFVIIKIVNYLKILLSACLLVATGNNEYLQGTTLTNGIMVIELVVVLIIAIWMFYIHLDLKPFINGIDMPKKALILSLIPIFNIFYFYYVCFNICDQLKKTEDKNMNRASKRLEFWAIMAIIGVFIYVLKASSALIENKSLAINFEVILQSFGKVLTASAIIFIVLNIRKVIKTTQKGDSE